MGDEFGAVVDAARKLRERDRYHAKKVPESIKMTYWDADDWKLLVESKQIKPVRVKTKFGYTLEIHSQWAKKEVAPEGDEIIIRCDGSHVVDFQFASEDHLAAIGKVTEVFGGAEIFELDFEGKQQMIDYCRKMDEIIVETAKELNRKKVASVFKKIWQEFGGADDRLVRRVAWYRDLVALYAQDKQKWLPDMKRVGLM